MTAAMIAASSYSTDEARWNAVLARDAEADGIFVYGVLTTGVYCRPSCPSRNAKRHNVRFFDLHAEAEAQGLRPCKRCRPDRISTSQAHSLVVEAACRRLESAEVPPDLSELAQDAGLSPWHFHRIFKDITGVTPAEYGRAARAPRVARALQETARVSEAVFESGSDSFRRFHDEAVASLGMTPASYRAGAPGEVILYSHAASSLGRVTAAFSQRGVCAVILGDSDTQAQDELRRRFPKAVLRSAGESTAELVAKIVAAIEEPKRAGELPLDIRGTAFQRRVWAALRTIPHGTTQSYSELARGIGVPAATRAVAGACGANPLAVLVPCHRVLRSDGGLGGYRWGVERKRRLLDREADG